MYFIHVLFLVFLCVTVGWAEMLPFVKPCKRTDPQLNACLLNTARESLPYFAKGDEKYNVQPIDPYRVKKYSTVHGGGSNKLVMTFSNVVVKGLKDIKILDAGVDLEKRRAHFDTLIPDLNYKGDYSVNGRLLLLPVVGNGDASSNMGDVQFNVTIDYDLEKKKFGTGPEKQYIKIRDVIFHIDFKRASMKVNNLFNGNKVLGDTFNTFLNGNTKEIFREMVDTMDEATTALMQLGYKDIQQFLSYDELFPE